MSCGEARIVEKGHPDFAKLMKHVMKQGNFNSHCVKEVKGEPVYVRREYALQHMRDRATVIAYVENGKELCGFGFGLFKKERGVKTFYVDLVCSGLRKGGALLKAMEGYASGKADVVALRAAHPGLIRYYQRHKYRRLANECEPPSRAQRALLRDLDRGAADVPGAPRGVYTDGVQVVSSIEDAWARVGEKKPRGSDLPPGWIFEEGDNGWWMTKCIKS